MKSCIGRIAAGPSGIVVEMIKAAGDVTMIRDLANAIICDGKAPADWEESFIVCLYKGKGYALDRGKYRGLKLTEQAMKILERTVNGLRWCLLTTPSLALSQKRHYRCNLCGPAAAGEIPSSEQEAFYGLPGPREIIYPSEGYLVGPEKARCRGMDCAVSPGNVR